MTLWTFGNDGDGLLIVCADTAEDAKVKRDAWVIEQRRIEDVRLAWWAKVDETGLRDERGWMVRGQSDKQAIEMFGPFPEPGEIYYDVKGDPTDIGEFFAYQWSE